MCASRVVTTPGLYLNAAKLVRTYVRTYIHTSSMIVTRDSHIRVAPRPYVTQTANKFAIYTPEYIHMGSEKCTAKPREDKSDDHNTRKYIA